MQVATVWCSPTSDCWHVYQYIYGDDLPNYQAKVVYNSPVLLIALALSIPAYNQYRRERELTTIPRSFLGSFIECPHVFCLVSSYHTNVDVATGTLQADETNVKSLTQILRGRLTKSLKIPAAMASLTNCVASSL